ncbi:MAG: hypothetical protein F4053_12215 [Proteobacteria bacterium]|nr:hypothetical protein [Pseudomonadota bacterium]
MKAQAEQLAKMSDTLESSGFSRPQSNAVIESVALAMETFAVTPEILDARIDGLRDELNARFAAQDAEIETLGKSVVRIEDKVDRFGARMSAIEQSMFEFQQRMIEFQRSTIRYMLAFLVLMLGAVVGMFGTFLTQLFIMQ